MSDRKRWGCDLSKWLIVKSRTGDGKWWVFRPYVWREKVVPTFDVALRGLIPITHVNPRGRAQTDEDVVLMNHSTPVAVLVAMDRYDALLDEIEDLKDRISVHEQTGVTIPADKLMAELGLNT